MEEIAESVNPMDLDPLVSGPSESRLRSPSPMWRPIIRLGEGWGHYSKL